MVIKHPSLSAVKLRGNKWKLLKRGKIKLTKKKKTTNMENLINVISYSYNNRNLINLTAYIVY